MENKQEVTEILSKLQNHTKAFNIWKSFLGNIQNYIEKEWIVEGYDLPTMTELTMIINPFIINSKQLSVLASFLNEKEMATLFKFMVFGIHEYLKAYKK